MKIPIRYGLLITLGVMAWVLIARNTVTDPESIIHKAITPTFITLFQFVMIYLGLRALEREKGDRPTFKEGLKTGVAISAVYFVAASLFFVGVIVVMGTKWLESEPGAAGAPMSRLVTGAFMGLFLGAMLGGLIYSTVISFFIAKRATKD